MLSEEKITNILNSMEGITYSEWTKLNHCIECTFKAEISNQNNKILIADADTIIKKFKWIY